MSRNRWLRAGHARRLPDGGEAGQLAPEVLSQLLNVLRRQLRIRLGRLDQRGGQRLARGAQVVLGLAGIAGPPQRQRLLLRVLREGGDPLAVGLWQQPPAAVQRAGHAHTDRARRRPADHEPRPGHSEFIVAAPVDGRTPANLSAMGLEAVPGWARELVGRARVARLAYIDGDDRPRVLPVTFAVAGGAVWTAIDDKPKRRPEPARVEYLRRRPEASLLVDVYDDDWTRLAWVQLLGRVDVVEAGLA